MNCLLPNLCLQNFENVELMMVKQSKKDSITQKLLIALLVISHKKPLTNG